MYIYSKMVGYTHCPIYTKDNYDADFEPRPVVWITVRSLEQLIPSESLLMGRMEHKTARVLRIPNGKGGYSTPLPTRYKTELQALTRLMLQGVAFSSGVYQMVEEERHLFGASKCGLVICSTREVEAAVVAYDMGCRIVENFNYPGTARSEPEHAKYRGNHWAALRLRQITSMTRDRVRSQFPISRIGGEQF